MIICYPYLITLEIGWRSLNMPIFIDLQDRLCRQAVGIDVAFLPVRQKQEEMMKKVIIIAIGPLILFIGGCDLSMDFSGMFGEPVDPGPPPPFTYLDVTEVKPTAIKLNTLYSLPFIIEWEVDSSLLNSVDLQVIFFPVDSGGWIDPLVIDTIRTTSGEMEFTANLFFKSTTAETKRSSDVRPYALFRIYDEQQRWQRASKSIYFDVIP